MAPLAFTARCDEITAQVWEKTMEELEFAYVREIIKEASG